MSCVSRISKKWELFNKELISETHYYSLLMDMGMNVDQIDALKRGEKINL
jgi:DNA-directed RNA polymerase subunit N (RpoN/RPB10)